MTINNASSLGGGDQISIANAAVEPHAGALRAADEVSGTQVTGPFALSGFTGLTSSR